MKYDHLSYLADYLIYIFLNLAFDIVIFQDTLTGDEMYIGDAIMRGFLKARKIEDAHGVDIDPRNRMVIDKTETIKKKLLKPLSVISAFRKAAAAIHK